MDSLGALQPYGEARAAPRGAFMGWLADLLGGTKGFLNQARVPQGVPLVGGLGAGDLMGQAPETLDSMSYGFSPVRGAGMAATLDPGVADLLGLMAPLAGRAAGVARALPGVARQAALDAYSPAVNVARPRYTLGGREVPREVLQQEFGFLPSAEEVNKAMKEAKKARADARLEEIKKAGRLNWTPAEGFGSKATVGSFEDTRSPEELLQFILDKGKTLPNTGKFLPNPYQVRK